MKRLLLPVLFVFALGASEGRLCAEDDAAEVFRGKTSVTAFAAPDGSHEISVSIHKPAHTSQSDMRISGPVIQTVMIQTLESWSHPDLFLDSAVVIVKRDSVAVVAEGENLAFEFRLADSASPPARAGDRVSKENVTRIEAFGIARYYEKADASKSADFTKILPTCSLGITGCEAGGPGASRCSISGCDGAVAGCTASCRENYSACCACWNERACCKCIAGG